MRHSVPGDHCPAHPFEGSGDNRLREVAELASQFLGVSGEHQIARHQSGQLAVLVKAQPPIKRGVVGPGYSAHGQGRFSKVLLERLFALRSGDARKPPNQRRAGAEHSWQKVTQLEDSSQ